MEIMQIDSALVVLFFSKWSRWVRNDMNHPKLCFVYQSRFLTQLLLLLLLLLLHARAPVCDATLHLCK